MSFVPKLLKLAAGAGVVGGLGGVMFGGLSMVAKGAESGHKEGQEPLTVLNVSKTYVQEHLASQPQLVHWLNELSHMCVAEETGQAQTKLRELVRHMSQLVHKFGKFARCATEADVFLVRKDIFTLTTKVTRDCNALQLLLVNYVCVDSLRHAVQMLNVHLSNFLAMVDAVGDNTRAELAKASGGKHSSGARRVEQLLRIPRITKESIGARLQKDIPGAVGAMKAFASWACDRDSSDTVTEAKLRIHKMTTHLLQLRHAVKLSRDEGRVELLQMKIDLGLKAIRFDFQTARSTEAFECPFFDIRNIVAEFKAGLA